jgi:protein-L-isoaspartate(D-aspartate) O-methyltransferase
MDPASARRVMVERSIRARGIRDLRVLEAVATVPREAFLPPELAEFAYDDRPLPIDAGQTISQPYVVALMTEALQLRPGEVALEIGTGSGYAAAVLAHVAGKVYSVERHAELAELSRRRLADLGYAVEVRHGDGTLGWPEHAPFDAIVVAAGGPEPPSALLGQLAIGGRLVMPVGTSRAQELIRITRISATELRREDLGAVMFVPLIGEQGWAEPGQSDRGVWTRSPPPVLRPPSPASRPTLVSKLIAECAEPYSSIDDARLEPLLDRMRDARVVLLGEATHGTAEFYRMRTRITQELILRHGFRAVAVEADWPDAAVLDEYVRGRSPRPRDWTPFARFPTWMWRNDQTRELVEWLRAYNAEVGAPERKVSFSGLDLYSMYTSAYEVVRYLDRVDPVAARAARERYGRLTPWQDDPAAYGRAVLVGNIHSYEGEVVTMLRELLAKRLDYAAHDGDAMFDATQNARVVAGAEAYYRTMYYGSIASWNLRDQHMFDTLDRILDQRGGKLVVWEHNSHVGDASATEMAARGEHNVGQLCRRAFGDAVHIVGFGTDRGTVAAAHDWEGVMEVMRVRPARGDSYERLCHEAGVPGFVLALRHPARDDLRDELAEPRLERAIGVVYRPETELQSHYFQAVLPAQFDDYIWFDETSAVDPLPMRDSRRPSLDPFA